MSEVDIANNLREIFTQNGINDYWYDVPFNVLIGVKRFQVGLTTSDYQIKSPSPDAILEEGETVYVDFAPMDPRTGIWGDWSSTCVFRPKTTDFNQAQFLEDMRSLHRQGIFKITAATTGADVAQYYLDRY